MNLYLIDGSAILHRAYFSYPPMEHAGRPVNAIYGFCDILWGLIDRFRPEASHIGMIFDKGGPTFRHKLYSEYKANRKKKDDDLVAQFEGVREASRAFNLPVIELSGYEADDIIATYTKRAVELGVKTVIVSNDKDLMQLVKDGSVEMYDPINHKLIGEGEVRDKFGVHPSQVGDVLALMGDVSDNIPGVPGIGIKTASRLIYKYGNLKYLFEIAPIIADKPKSRQALSDHKETVLMSQKLVTLDCELPILENDLQDLEVRILRPGLLYAFLEKMDFKLLLSRME